MTTDDGEVPAVDKAFRRVEDGIAAVKAELPGALDKLTILGEIIERARRDELMSPELAGVGLYMQLSRQLDVALIRARSSSDWPTLRETLTEAAAVAVNWILYGDRRQSSTLLPLLEWWGEEGERIGTPGHVDLETFAAAAKQLARNDLNVGDDELADMLQEEPEHIWLRPLTVEYAINHYKVHEARARALVGSGEHFEPCGAADAGAEPYTVIDVEQ